MHIVWVLTSRAEKPYDCTDPPYDCSNPPMDNLLWETLRLHKLLWEKPCGCTPHFPPPNQFMGVVMTRELPYRISLSEA